MRETPVRRSKKEVLRAGLGRAALAGRITNRSVDGSRRHHPLTWLAGGPRDEVEVRVVVEHGQPGFLRGRRDEQVGDLPPAQTSRCEHPLDLAGTSEVG